MLRRTSEIKNFALKARNGDLGRTKDFYFEDSSWTIRYLVADTGKWISLRQVLISPHAIRGVRENERVVDVDLTTDQIENSPSIDQDRPVSRQFEEQYYRYYNYPFYWQGAAMWGPYPTPMGSSTLPVGEPSSSHPQDQSLSAGDPHLRSTQAVTGYHILARDGEIGHVEDFVYDDEDWAMRYLIVDTVNWWPGKKVLVLPAHVLEVRWRESQVVLKLDRTTIKNAPEYDPAGAISPDFDHRLRAYYQQHAGWEGRVAA